MTKGNRDPAASDFASFGELLRFLRRRARLTQEELARAVGYSREQVTRLEANQRAADRLTVNALFLPALDLPAGSPLAARLLALAAREKAAAPAPAPRTNLSAPLTRFIGREREVAEIERLLLGIPGASVPPARLLALTGAGGVGKTRLALQAGLALLPRFAGGVWLVELAALDDPDLVPAAVAAVFGLSAAPGRDVIDTLRAYLRDKHLLLILDNCEHLLVACARLAESLLRAAPQLSIMATTRESLGILSATTWRVPSLALPAAGASLEQLRAAEAVRLFTDRAQSSHAAFELTPANAAAVAEICRRLDGVALAIELAATRVSALPVQEIAAHLSERFQLLTAGNLAALPRHRTLRALIDWSYDLLAPDERALFRLLAVYAGGCALDTLEALDGAGALAPAASLVDKSLLVMDERQTPPRYHLLETLREYALEKLEAAGELEPARDRHLAYFAAFAAEHEPRLRGPQQQQWYRRFDAEQDNLRAALDWAVRRGAVGPGLQLVDALWFYWFWRGHWAEGARRARAVLELPGEMDARLRGRALVGASNLAGRAGDYATSGRWLAEGTRLVEQAGNAAKLAWARLDATFGVRDEAEVGRLLEQALAYARGAGDLWFQAEVLHVWGERAQGRGELERAQALYAESERLFRAAGDAERVAMVVGNAGIIAYERGDDELAAAAYAQSLAMARERNDRPGVANWQLPIARLALRRGDPARALEALAECLPIFLELDDQEALADAFVVAANRAGALGRVERAAMLLGAAGKILERFNLLHQVVSPAGYAEFTRAVEAARRRRGEAAFQPPWEAGRSLSLQDAIACALEGEQPASP